MIITSRDKNGATTHNTVMARTFSKIHGLASLRIGWAYCPAAIADALNRIRGPFNVSGPAIAAGVAGIEDHAHVQHTVEHNEAWRGRMAEALAANFLLVHFPDEEASAAAADAFLQSQRILLRRMTAYLPNALRMTIGTEDTITPFSVRSRPLWAGTSSPIPDRHRNGQPLIGRMH